MQKKLLAVKHRHFVFSIPKELRKYFRLHRTLLNELIKVVHASFKMLIQNSKKRKRERWTHGMISVMHNYGPDIDDYAEDGKAMSAKAVAEYIARYASHPAIAESRIIHIDYEKHQVTWIYDPHEDDKKPEGEKLGRQTITKHVFDFMIRLIIHIPDKGFHLIRYQGFYANHSNIKTQDYKHLYHKSYLLAQKQNISWERMLILNFKYTPLLCKCGGQMILSLDYSFLPRNRGPTYEN